MAAVGTGVSIGSRNVRVVQVRKQKDGSWQVQKALVAPMAEAEPSEQRRLAEGKSAITSSQAKGGAFVGVSGRDLIMRYTHVPPVPDWRLEMLMNFEIQEVSEQSGGDVSAAYAQLQVDDTTSGDNVVLVALAKNAHLKPRLEALAASGLDPLGGTPRAVAAFTAYREVGKLGIDETVVLVHIGHENTDVAIARKGSLLFARNVAGGGKLLTDAIMQNLRVDFPTAEKLKITKGNLTPRGKAKYRDSMEEKVANAMMGAGGHFVSAINSSVMFAKAQTKVPDCDVARVVLMGGGSLLKGLPEYVESNLNVPVEVFDPLASVDLSALPAEAANAIKQDQGGMAVALGLAQMAADESALRVAILPEADKKKRAFRQKTVFVLAAAAVAAAGVVVAWSMRGAARAEGQRERDQLAAKLQLFQKNKDEFDKASRRVEQVNAQKDALRSTVTLGPTLQIVEEMVQSVMNSGGDDGGYREIVFDKSSARMTKERLKDANGADLDEFVMSPEIALQGSIADRGVRPVSQCHAEFMAALKKRITDSGFLRIASDSGLQTDRTFRITIRQTTYPEAAKGPEESR
ncbi:MAG: Cell division protein FtsA [Planctomycetes bacterium]|nr:Cell division protein FtsA [Planctomycetota bacterium]